MVNKLFEHIGTKIVLANPWLDTYSVNCIEIPFSNGEKRIVNLEGDEKVDLSINDVSGNGFYIKINPRFTYTEQRQLSSTKRDFLVSIRFRFVFFGINTEIEYSKLGLENKFATVFRNISFSDYIGNERSVKLNISQTNTDALQIFKEEVGKDYDFGAESVFIALDGVLSFLSTDNYCDSECGIAVSESTLKTLDFCDPAIIALLNEKQRECLAKEFGGGGLTCEDLATCQTIIDILNLISAIQSHPTLAQVLANGNTTNELIFASNNGASELSIHNTEISFQYSFLNGFDYLAATDAEFRLTRSSGDTYCTMTFDDAYSLFSYYSGLKAGYLKAEETQTEIFHDDLINLTAPSVKKNGEEVLSDKWYADVNGNSNTLINLRDAVAPQEPITKSQFDSYISAVGSQRGSIDCSTNPNYPASNVGDRWEVTVSGKIGGASGIDVQVYDEIVCKTQSVAGDQATVGMNFYVVQGNLERASETVSGYTQYATDAEVQGATENTKTFTPLKLENWWVNIKTLAQTFAAKITFTSAPRFNSTTASQRLEVDANKDLISVAKGTADNKDFGTTSGTVCEGNDTRLTDTRNSKAVFKSNVLISHTGTTANTKKYSALIPAGTFQANDIFKWFAKIGATSNANTKTIRFYFNTTDDLLGSPVLVATHALSSGGTAIGMDRALVFQNSLTSQQIGNPSAAFQSEYSALAAVLSTVNVDTTVDQYFIVAEQLNNSADTMNLFYIYSEITR